MVTLNTVIYLISSLIIYATVDFLPTISESDYSSLELAFFLAPAFVSILQTILSFTANKYYTPLQFTEGFMSFESYTELARLYNL